MRDYTGIPYLVRGDTFDGCDCWGLVRIVYRDLGIELPSYADYAGEIGGLVDGLVADDIWHEVDEPAPLDVVLLRADWTDYHIGLIIGPGMMLHTVDLKNSCIENYNRPYWRPRLRGFFRYAR